MAARTHDRASGSAHPWADPLGWLPLHEPLHNKLPSGRSREYSYVRYFFSNLSSDIRRIFIEHSALLGIRVTQPNHRNLAVSHRDSVKILDEIVGPKA